MVALLCLGWVWCWHLAVAASYNAAMSLNKSGSPRKETEAEKQSRLLDDRANRSTILWNRLRIPALCIATFFGIPLAVKQLAPDFWDQVVAWLSASWESLAAWVSSLF